MYDTVRIRTYCPRVKVADAESGAGLLRITGRCRRRGTGRDGAAVALLRADRQRAQRVWSGCQGGKELLCQPL